jgi:hypothetical protein
MATTEESQYTDTCAAILRINPDARVTISTNNKSGAETIEWNNDTTEISKADIDAKKVELKAEWITLEYARNRAEDYPSYRSQLEKIYDDGIIKWKSEMVDPVKTKWPKDNSGPR